MAQASVEKLEDTGPADKERVVSVPQREQLVNTREPLCQKGKEQSRLSRVPDHEGGETNGGREQHLGECKGGLEREHREERVDSTLKESKFQGGHGGQARKASLRTSRRKHERVNGRKSSPGRSAESWFHSKSRQT